jgi:hypothetical protein
MSTSLRILSETRVDIYRARCLLGTDDRPIHFTTVYRLMKRGLQAPSGDRVVLESVRVGLRRITSVEAIERFVAATNGIDPDAPDAVEVSPARRSKARERELAGLDRYLDSELGRNDRQRPAARGG